jgi:hypothetical protein
LGIYNVEKENIFRKDKFSRAEGGVSFLAALK